VLWAGSEDRAGILKFALETQINVRVQIVQNQAEFRECAKNTPAIDLVMLLAGEAGPTTTDARLARKLVPFEPVVAIGSNCQGFVPWTTDTVLQDAVPMAELMDRCRTWLTKKRGPRKGMLRAVAPSELVASVA
jgi:hypothetical protein